MAHERAVHRAARTKNCARSRVPCYPPLRSGSPARGLPPAGKTGGRPSLHCCSRQARQEVQSTSVIACRTPRLPNRGADPHSRCSGAAL